MALKLNIPIVHITRLLAVWYLLLFLSGCSNPPRVVTAKAEMRDIEVVVSTNGIIEPIDSIGIYAPVNGFVQTIHCSEGSEIVRGESMMEMDASQTRVSLAEAEASLLEARRQSRIVLDGPSKEELDSLDASIRENALKLQQITEEISTAERLLNKGAVSEESVEDLKKQQELLQMQAEALKQNKENLFTRYSEEEKKLEQDKVAVLDGQVRLLERQVRDASIKASTSGVLYALSVERGSFVTQGQLLAQIYQPGRVRLRAYVDEPDLGRIHKDQQVKITWDGMPGAEWTGMVNIPAERAVALNNRSVGHVLCTINNHPEELLPNINVKVEIITDFKANALVVPRSAVFSYQGGYAILLPDETGTVIRKVDVGLITYNEMEILQGIHAGDSIAINPREVLAIE